MKTLVIILHSFVNPGQLLSGILFFSILNVAIILFVLAHLAKRMRKGNYRKTLRNYYSELISLLALCETEKDLEQVMKEATDNKDLQVWMQDAYARHILIREMVTGVKSMSGTANSNICWFYSKMGLEKDTLTRLKAKDWHIKAKAIQALSYLGQKQHITRIYRLTNNNNELVRHEARIAVVKLTGFEGLRFLDIISHPITDWQQLHLLHELSKQNKTDFKDIGRWLTSPNPSVTEFALRLVEVYRVFDLYDAVVALLQHPADTVRSKAIRALCEIRTENTGKILLDNYGTQNAAVQLGIVKAMQEVGTENEIDFLSRCLAHERDDFKMAAARAIRNINKEGFSIIEQAVNKALEPWPVLLPQLLREERG